MPARTTVLALVFGLCALAPAADPPERDDGLRVKLAEMPNVRLRPRPPLTLGKALRIKVLIARLVDVDRPDVGYSQTFGGFAFLPVPGHVQEDSLTWTNHRLKTSQALRDLVAIGPDALPFLLDALEDKTPTKLILKHCGTSEIIREGATWFSDELSGNRLNPREARVIDAPNRKLKDGEHVETYTVRVGDLCFVAIGQIVGRPYMAARYQMTSCTVINSPVEDPAFRERIRKIWASDDPTRTVFESLWTDYRTTGVTRLPDHTGWSYGSCSQTTAALRLLYYFPEEFAPVIAERLNKLDVSKAVEGTEGFVRQGVANGGVYADEFVHAAAWCREPEVREAVRGIFRRTEDVRVFAAAAEAFGTDEGEVIVKKANELLDGLTNEERKQGARYYLLSMIAARVGAAAGPTFRKAMEKADPAELGSLAGALEQTEGDWPVALLKPLLDDKRPTDRIYYVRDETKSPRPAPVPGGDDGYRKVPVRVCDAAAETLGALLPGERGKFPADHDRATLDRYIARLKEKIDRK